MSRRSAGSSEVHNGHGHDDDGEDEEDDCADDDGESHGLSAGAPEAPASQSMPQSSHRSSDCRQDLAGGRLPKLSVVRKELWPPNHQLVNVGLRVDVGEACCGRAQVSLRVFSDEPDNGSGDGDTPFDAQLAPPNLYLRKERSGSGDGRVYLIEATATHEGVSATRCTTVVVPKSQSGKDRDRARQQACAARAYCGVAGVPPGFHLVAQGPLVGANRAPSVNAGPDLGIDLGSTAQLQGVVTDDGLPTGSPLDIAWSQVEGPGAVTFNPVNAAETTAAFSAPGAYKLRLTANDSQLQASDDVVVVVEAANMAPVVDAGPDRTLTLPATNASLQGTASDDGLPSGSLSVAWGVVSGPGPVTFGPPDQASSSATLSTPGEYVLRLTANDGQLETSDDVRVVLYEEPPPTLSAADGLIDEGQEGDSGALVTLSLSKPWPQPVSVDFVTADGTASASCDYRPRYGTVTFEPGQTQAAILVPVVGERVPEADEALKVLLGNPVNVLLAQTEAAVVLKNDDGGNAAPSFSGARAPLDEAAGAKAPLPLSWTGLDPDPADVLGFDVELGTAFGTTGQLWTQVCPLALGPGPRSGAVSAYDESSDRLMVFGGSGAPDPDTLWILENASGAGGAPTWTPIPTTGGPSGLQRAASGYDPATNRLIVHGGCSGSCASAPGETWLLGNANGLTGAPQWSLVDASGPGGRVDASAVYDPASNRLILMGGGADPEEGGALDDVWILVDANGVGAPAWEPLAVPSGPSPGPRRSAAAAFDSVQGRIFLFGGRDADGLARNDLWELRLPGPTPEWRSLEVPGGPAPRWGHALAFDPGSRRLLLFGGTNEEPGAGPRFVFGDAWLLTAESPEPAWIRIDAPGVTPAPRFRPVSAYSPGANRLIVALGANGGDSSPTGLWTLSDAAGRLPLVSLSQTSQSYTADSLDPGATYLWRVIVRDSGGAWRGSAVWRFTGNEAPVVDSGADAQASVPDGLLSLSGSVADDGLPAGASVTAQWTLQSGPAAVSFTDPASPVTTVTFPLTGTYVLRLTASDGSLASQDETTVVVTENQGPSVDAGPDRAIALPVAEVLLDGTAADDGKPGPGPLALAWAQVAGPQPATLASPNQADSMATFSSPGTYSFRLTATDGVLSASDDVSVVVAAENAAPSVDAGPDRVLSPPQSGLSFAATALDDGLPAGSTLSVAWTKQSGPAPVSFDDGTSLATVAHFTSAGTYVIRVSVSDGQLTGMDDVTVDVLPANLPPAVSAGPDLALPGPGSVDLVGLASDDGLPAGALTMAWSLAEGPSPVQFADPASVSTAAAFSSPGIYVVRLAASDGALTTLDEATIAVGAPGLQPDLTIAQVDASALSVDPHSLAVSGVVAAQIKNTGLAPAVGPFSVLFFEDVDGDGAFGAGDAVLGTAEAFGLDAGATATVTAEAAGGVSFAGNLVFAFVDSALSVAESQEGNNLGNSAAACEYTPTSTAWNPTVKWSWTPVTAPAYTHVVMSGAAVVDLDGDKRPEVVFTAHLTPGFIDYDAGLLRVIDGRDGSERFTVDDPLHRVSGGSGLAVGDLDGDGHPEIVAFKGLRKAITAFRHDGTFLWDSDPITQEAFGSLSLADLDADGTSEIVVGRQVLNHDGTLRWTGTGGSGLNQGFGPHSVVVDLDLNADPGPRPEVLAGNTAYYASGPQAGQILWRNTALPDGFTAVANFDADPNPEIVLVASGQVWLLEHTGSVIWGPVDLPGAGAGSAPVIGDLDGDGQPEIVVMGTERLAAFEGDGTLKWSAPLSPTSGFTIRDQMPKALFDFDGDGAAEVVMNDGRAIRIHRGSDGVILAALPFNGVVGPLSIVDVDGDGPVEIVAGDNGFFDNSSGGLRAFHDASGLWGPGRAVWNQVAYRITNVNDDGTLPRVEAPPSLNAYRQQALFKVVDGIPLPGCPYAKPDLVPSYFRSSTATVRTLTVRIGNGGTLPAREGTPVSFYDGDPLDGGALLGTVFTTATMPPGRYEDVALTLPLAQSTVRSAWVAADDYGSLVGAVTESDETNNRLDSGVALKTVGGADLVVADVDDSGLAGAGKTLAVSGVAKAVIQNQGTAEAPGPFDLSFFDDRDGDGILTPGVDEVLGTVTSPSLAPAASSTVTAMLAGTQVFRGRPLSVFVDSGGVVPEADETNNVAVSGRSCRQELGPPYTVQVERSWQSSTKAPTSTNVSVPPLVIDLDGDGVADTVFVTFVGGGTGTAGRLRAIDGRTGAEMFTVTNRDLRALVALAAGDLDLTDGGRPEILALSLTGPQVLAFSHDGALKWQSPNLENVTYASLALADLDGDGHPEILAGRHVVSWQGALLWKATGDFGSNGGSGAAAVAVDLDLDGRPEVLLGRTAYRGQGPTAGTALWTLSVPSDGIVSAANLDDDPHPEIVFVSGNEVRLFDHQGTLLWGPVALPGTGLASSPTLADFDGDGRPEIGVGMRSSYSLVEAAGFLRWSVATDQATTAANRGLVASAFDFDGDGSLELILADESGLRVVKGRDGSTLASLPLESCGFGLPYPVVADADGDGNAEIVAAANNACAGSGTHGVFVVGEAKDRWATARALWNQHDYHVTNVADSGAVPPSEPARAGRANGVRHNVPGKGSPRAGANVTASFVRRSEAGTNLVFTVRVGNGGAVPAPSGIPVSLFNGDPRLGFSFLATAPTSKLLLPGQYEDVSIAVASTTAGDDFVHALADGDAGQQGVVAECDEDDNLVGSDFHLNLAPTADAGTDRALSAGVKTTALEGAVSDDGLPLGASVKATWFEVGDPANPAVTFEDRYSPTTVAHFAGPGVFHLRLVVSDTVRTSTDDVLITIVSGNQPPTVDAGPDQVVVLPDHAVALSTSVTDDGFPAGGDLTVSWSKVSGPGAVTFDSSSAPTTVAHLGSVGTFVLRLMASDGALSAEDQVVVYLDPANQAPVVSAGPDRVSPSTTVLAGSVADDGFPRFKVLESLWTVISGPGPATFGDAASPTTGATFAADGDYRLRLTATDGALQAFDEVVLHVNPPNQAPLVSAGSDLSFTLPPTSGVTLAGSVTDDGLPFGASVLVSWSQVGGPAPVSFASPGTPSTLATFSTPGVYTLRLTASDSALTSVDDVIVTVVAGNLAPSVDGGSDQGLVLPTRSTSLLGTVTDDGLPAGGALAFAWTKLSGPGAAVFSAPQSLGTEVVFDAAGTYVLKLTASDGALSAADTLTVNVSPTAPVGPPPAVSIDSPAERARITSLAEIQGSATSAALFLWKLEQRAVGDATFAPLATGDAPVSAAVLGTLDPTLLRNGLYELRLTATDTANRSSAVSRFVVVRENQKIGQFTVSFVDLEVPVAGLPLRVTRTYDSRDKGKGDFGIGWRMDLSDVRVQQSSTTGLNWYASNYGIFTPYCLQALNPAIVTVTLPDGRVLEFEPTVNPSCQTFVPIQETTVGYRPIAPTRGTLAPAGGGKVIVVGSLGPVQLFGATDFKLYDPRRFQLTTEDGRVWLIDQAKGLERVTDLNGNKLQVSPSGVLNCPAAVSSGPTCKGVSFTRDPQGRISVLTDPEGNGLSYAYDANGDLVTSTDREQNATSFTYESDIPHHLKTIEDPLGRTPIRNEYYPDGRLQSHTDAFGKTIVYTHDLSTRQEVVTDREGQVRVLEYDERGNVVKETQPNGKLIRRTFDARNNRLTETEPHDPANSAPPTTSYSYDISDNLLSTTDALSNTTTYAYNARKQVLTTTDARGKSTTNTYDAKGNLLSSTDALGQVTAYAYDARGNVTSQTITVGGAMQTTTYAYDVFGNLTKEKDAVGHETTYTYDKNGNRLTQTTSRTAPAGVETLVTSYAYDKQGRLTQTTDPDGTFTKTVYDALGRQVESHDKLGRVTGYLYDEMGRLVRTTYPDLTMEESTYDGEGRRLTSKDRGGRTTAYEYDALGRLRKTLYPDATFTTNTYDAAGRLVATTDARGKTTTYEYDASGRRTKVQDPLGNETVFTYDPNGNQKTVRDARLNTVAYEYDDLNRRTKTIFPPAETGATPTFTTTTYDELGRRTSETDPAGKTTSFQYDALGRLAKVIDALGQETVYEYDELGNRTVQRDANGHDTRFEYDKLGRQAARILPDGKREAMTYDAAGNLETRTDFMGRVTTYAHDVTNRLTSRSYPNPAENVTFTYTATGRRATATDSRGTTTHGYDFRDRLTSLVQPADPGSVLGSLTLTYDGNGNRTSLTASIGAAPGSPSYTSGYTYDDAGRLDVVTDPVGRAYGHGYDPNGNRSSLVHPNGVTTAYTYDNLNRLTNLAATRAAGVVLSQSLTLGPAGNRTKIVEHDGSLKDYGYDSLYRLTSETVSGLFNYSKTFVYDPVGNRQSQTTAGVGSPGTSLAPGTLTYGYDTRDRTTAEGAQAYAWDDNGNLTTKDAEATYVWDHENRLTRVTKTNSTVVEYLYDPDGNRVETKTTPPLVGGVPQAAKITDYLVDTSGSLSQVVAEIDASTATATLQAIYIRGDDLLAVMRPQVSAPAVAADWQSRFYHSDSIGSIRRLTDETGTITDGYTYSAFGELLGHSGTDPQPYAFTGEPLDPNSGFQYHRARWMDPRVGRFAAMDPWEGVEHDPSSLHRYLYAATNPVNAVDPTGRFTTIQTMAVGAIIGVLASQAILQTSGREFSLIDRVTVTVLGAALGAVGGALYAGSAVGVAVVPTATGVSVWLLPPFLRGGVIEDFLGRTLPRNYPVIDRFVGGIAGSIKSIDLTAKTYQSAATLARTLNGYVNQLSTWAGRLSPWGGAPPILPVQIASRQLTLAIPPGAGAAQLQVLNQVAIRAATLPNPVQVVIVTVK